MPSPPLPPPCFRSLTLLPTAEYPTLADRGLVLPGAAEDQGRCLRAALNLRPDLPALHPDIVHPALCLHSATGQDLTYLSRQGWNLYFDGSILTTMFYL